MNKTKLDLNTKSDAGITDLGTTHKTAMAGNANFTTPTPTATVFDAILATAITALADVAAKRAAWRGAVAVKNDALAALKAALATRANYVDTISEGDEAKILSSGFDLRTAPTPSQPLSAPAHLTADMGEMEGTLDLSWDATAGADSYVIECSANVMPRVFAQVKIATRSDFTATDLTSGQRYVFRVAAVGPLGQGPWSDEATKMAP